ncbi:cell division protein ZipA [Alteromonadaceae bacterium BrNp21-10]|nr:cell division protein ZipA [Alteromonadaceae bacterium BrNp21-10]
MEELRLPLLILGIFAIAGILVHGLWTIRKNAQKKATRADTIKALSEQSDSRQRDNGDGFDEHGIGKVRVIQVENDPHTDGDDVVVDRNSRPTNKRSEPVFSSDIDDAVPNAAPPASKPKLQDEQPNVSQASAQVAATKAATASQQASSGANTANAKPASNDYPDPPASLLLNTGEGKSQFFEQAHKPETQIQKTEFLEDTPLVEEPEAPVVPAEKAKKISLAEQAKKLVSREKPLRRARRTEPKVDEEQLRIDFDDQPIADTKAEEAAKADSAVAPAKEQNNAPPEQEVLVLNVKMPNDGIMQGSALLPMLLTLGFKFGQHDIFHRHVNSNGKGPTLFSLANMFAPGVFDIDNMETFKTQGVSLFMVLPIEGDPHQVFNMMHNAARKIADEFGAQILDARRALLTKQALQQYVDKIRESERRRKIKR